MDADPETTIFGEVALRIGAWSVVAGIMVGIGNLGYYTIGPTQETSALQSIKSGRWSEQVKINVQKTYINLFASFFICIVTAAIVFSDPVLFSAFTSFSMVLVDFVIEMSMQSGKTLTYLSSGGILSPQRMVWTAYCAFLGGISSPAYLLGPATVRVSVHITCIIIAALLILSLIAPAGKYAAWRNTLQLCEFFVFISTVGANFFPISSSLGASFFSMSFYGGLILFSMCFLCHSQEAQLSAYESTPENPYSAMAMSVPMLMDTLSIFSRILIMFPFK